jgi:hypothetical protein
VIWRLNLEGGHGKKNKRFNGKYGGSLELGESVAST